MSLDYREAFSSAAPYRVDIGNVGTNVVVPTARVGNLDNQTTRRALTRNNLEIEPAMQTIEGTVVIAQESRFLLRDDAGVHQLFVLDHRAQAEPQQLAGLQARQARVRVLCSRPRNELGLIAHSVTEMGTPETVS